MNQQPLRVMLVAEDSSKLQTLCAGLQRAGYLVKLVHTCREALVAARSFLPDLFVSSFTLPDLDSVAAAVEIKQWDAACEVLLLGPVAKNQQAMRTVNVGGFSLLIVSQHSPVTDLLRDINFVLDQRAYYRKAS